MSNKSIKITATGDSMLLRPFPNGYEMDSIVSYIKKGDVRLTNLEMVLTDGGIFASTFCGGEWIASDKKNFDSLNTYGFNMYACSNNHTMDYSYGGLLETYDYLKSKNICFSGIGRSLIEANAPCFYKCKNEYGQEVVISMISLTTTFIDAARAGDANEHFSGRPGLNVVRNNSVYYVNDQEMNILKEIARKTEINGERDNARRNGTLPPEKEGTFNFGGIFFEESKNIGKRTECDKRDLNRVIDTIHYAKNNSDYVIVMAHSHQIKHSEFTEPDYFFEDLCRQCIDAGACCVVGSGTHQLKPIEFYKDKPIFYSLGNFIFECHRVEKLPIDFWEKYNFDKNMTIVQMEDSLSKNGTVGLEYSKENYLSIIPYLEFDEEKLVKIQLLPIQLNFEKDDLQKGLPVLATEEEVEIIFNQLETISKSYGTNFVLNNGLIEIKF